jgi:hypothetical protein
VSTRQSRAASNGQFDAAYLRACRRHLDSHPDCYVRATSRFAQRAWTCTTARATGARREGSHPLLPQPGPAVGRGRVRAVQRRQRGVTSTLPAPGGESTGRTRS